ncbi:MAG: Endonuclease/exonuclease/phosphatase [Bacteriovoracaceae bacterium]|nr:Endonuclease/exonuclease/phosphatase [Bacteriovoracaceae bacterium]
MSKTIKILSLNTHKGFSHFNTRFVLSEIRDALRSVSPDIVFLQEVLGENHMRTLSFPGATKKSHYEYLADSIWSDYAYGKNAVYPQGHHGNAILSKFPIHSTQHRDISTHALEQRGILHCKLSIPGQRPVHCVCVHLNLLSFHREQQFRSIVEFVKKEIPPEDSLILAGDLNDWNLRAGDLLARPLKLAEAFQQANGKLAFSYPCYFPLLKLDRIYLRNFKAETAEVLSSSPWRLLSDHAALLTEVVILS